MADVLLRGQFLKNAGGLKLADGGGVTWQLVGSTLSVAGVSGSAPGNGSVTNATLADMAAATIKGRAYGGGTGVPQDLTATQIKAILGLGYADIAGLAAVAHTGAYSDLSGAPAAVVQGSGIAVVDFGAFPGASDASVVVTGLTGILSTSAVLARLTPKASADHTADEHWVETVEVSAGNIAPGTGFTIYARNTNPLTEQNRSVPSGRANDFGVGKGTLIYGKWNVAYMWAA